ncbi:MAG: AIR synthase-related protein, partial [Gordonibacter urolithinfaciens]
MVSRVYVEKKPGFDVEAQQLAHELRDILGIERLEGLRLVNRYDVEGISDELFAQCVPTVFSEPQSDVATLEMPAVEGAAVFAVEYLPGQFDQRADSASECIQLISQGERPEVRSAKVYLLEGPLADEDVAAIKHYVINPIEAREASLEPRETLRMEQPVPPMVETVEGFLDLDEAGLAAFIADRGLAMDLADLAFCQRYFAEEGRNPTITEIKMIDTYWSDHCRHTTFGTVLDDVRIDDEAVRAAFEKYLAMRHELGRDEKPVCLMDMGTIGARWLKAKGILTGLDESEEINACTVKVKVDVDGEEQDWLYLFKNETHNHPTEIEPFGGAATCVGGAIRDPLSGRSYVYQAMRLTGAADPLVPVSETLPGKLPQRKLVTTAAAGYSSYGNQIGLATGQVNELYHPGYAAKRMEIGAVVGATPADHVRRETPAPGDVIVLLGGRTGRDGIGGATGSSKAHKLESLETCGAEVQKGNAPVERKIQRLFRRGDACRMIKRCNDFGAGGVSVAVGELADGLFIDLNK